MNILNNCGGKNHAQSVKLFSVFFLNESKLRCTQNAYLRGPNTGGTNKAIKYTKCAIFYTVKKQLKFSWKLAKWQSTCKFELQSILQKQKIRIRIKHMCGVCMSVYMYVCVCMCLLCVFAVCVCVEYSSCGRRAS